MLKHVHITLRNRADSLSQNSSPSSSCASSLCGSPEPPNEIQNRTPSRASSYSSLTEAIPQVSFFFVLNDFYFRNYNFIHD